MRITLRHGQQHFVFDVRREAGAYRITVDGREHRVEAHRFDASTVLMNVDGERYRVALARSGLKHLIAIAGETYAFLPTGDTANLHSVTAVTTPEIVAPMPGKILKLLVSAGDRVAAGDGLVILEAMKMENRLTAEAAGTIVEVRVIAGDMVDGGKVLVVLAYDAA